MRLIDVARVVRSKNAGPLQLTIDLVFPDDSTFERARRSPALTPEAVAHVYGVDPVTVKVIEFGVANAIKIVMNRPIIAGSPGDSDVYGAQQHRPLLDVIL